MLGPFLFLIYVNDLDNEIISHILKFADDTTLYSVIRNCDDVGRLQQDLDRLTHYYYATTAHLPAPGFEPGPPSVPRLRAHDSNH